MLPLFLGIRVYAVDLDDRRALGEVGGDNDRDSLELADLLDLVTRGQGLQALKSGRELLLREQALLGILYVVFLLAGTAKDNLVLLVVVLVEERLLIMDGARDNLHLDRVLLGVLLHLLEVLIIAVLREPGNHVARRPVDLERVSVFIIDVVL